jgi:hypothetical protein
VNILYALIAAKWNSNLWKIMDVNPCCACHGTGLIQEFQDSDSYEYSECEDCEGTGEWAYDE